MILVGDTQWKNLEDSEKIAYCEDLFAKAKSARQKRDFDWYMNHMFRDGQHYVYYNRVTNSIEQKPRQRGEVRMVINKVNSSIRAIQNYATRSEPKWEIVPGDTDEDTVRNARVAGKLLDYLYRSQHHEVIIRGVIDSGLDTSVAWVELAWDDEAKDGDGDVELKLHDSFDIYPDPSAQVSDGLYVGKFLAKAIKRDVDDIKADKKYDKKARKAVEPDGKLAESNMKARILKKEGVDVDGQSDTDSTVKEFFLWDPEGNDKGGNLKLFTYAGGQVLRDEDLKKKKYPIYLYQLPQDPRRIYHRPWTSDAIPLNKALDRTMSQKIMYVNQALVYRLIAEKGHGVNVVTNEMGEVIEVNPNRNFEQMQMQPLPSAADNLTVEMSRFLEDILGAHDASLGAVPTGARSGKTLEALQAADSNNLNNINQSLSSFLSVLGREILELVAEKYQYSRVIKIAEPEDGQEELTRVIGQGAQDEVKREDAAIITGDNEVIVKIGSWLGHTMEAKRETLMQMYELGALDAGELLKQFEFPNVEELSKKAREQRLEQAALDAEIAGRNGQGQQSGQAGQAPQAGGQAQDGMVALADEENLRMAQGEAVPPTEDATPQHTQAHFDFMGSQTFSQLPQESQINIQTHANGELEG